MEEIGKSREENSVKSGEKGTEKVTNNQQIILDSILKNPYIISDELSAIVGIRVSTKGRIERVGADKGGYWMVV